MSWEPLGLASVSNPYGLPSSSAYPMMNWRSGDTVKLGDRDLGAVSVSEVVTQYLNNVNKMHVCAHG